jgi:hypothetical protein
MKYNYLLILFIIFLDVITECSTASNTVSYSSPITRISSQLPSNSIEILNASKPINNSSKYFTLMSSP